ncbi:MAG: NAD-dependent epimerase/dehydratase family protein [Pseudomonadota bacterium]
MTDTASTRRVFVTGSAGFIGFHLCRRLLSEGVSVLGYDGFTPYYDVALKRRRADLLAEMPRFRQIEAQLEDASALRAAVEGFQPTEIVHLAAQAGVRYSLENPRSYVEANLVGTFNLFEAARTAEVRHVLLASSSSVYGGNTRMPFRETDTTDLPLTIYAATKKATESLSHAEAHLRRLPVTAFRFFTVYGPWGRPDMALFKFVSAILEGRPIALHNGGDMYRDFTYCDDLVEGVRRLMDVIPGQGPAVEGDSLSPVAPWRSVNIGMSEKVRLGDFVEQIEAALGQSALRETVPIAPGEVYATWADATLLERLTGFRPSTGIGDGIPRFVAWYRAHYAG